MTLPSELVEVSAADDGFTTGFRWRITVERRVHTIVVIVNPEIFKLPLQVTGIQENYVVQKLAAKGPDQPFD